jgi:hypothetical protein
MEDVWSFVVQNWNWLSATIGSLIGATATGAVIKMKKRK